MPAKHRFARCLLPALLALAACGYVDYDSTEPGQFEGSLFVMWVGEGEGAGDGKFVFVPDPNNRLTFTWTDEQGNDHRIRPEMMYTDGGSIPKIAQVFNGFGPWGYAPAYMVHDWLYVARHCNLDGTPTPAEQEVAGLGFRASARIMASAIKTLVETGRVKPNDIATTAISDAVAGPVARVVWDRPGACAASRVGEADRLAAEAAIPGSSRKAIPPEAGVVPAVVVGAFSF